MAIFTFDDLEDMRREEEAFFGAGKEELDSPSAQSIDTVLAYSRSVSIRRTESLGIVQHHLN